MYFKENVRDFFKVKRTTAIMRMNANSSDMKFSQEICVSLNLLKQTDIAGN